MNSSSRLQGAVASHVAEFCICTANSISRHGVLFIDCTMSVPCQRLIKEFKKRGRTHDTAPPPPPCLSPVFSSFHNLLVWENEFLIHHIIRLGFRLRLFLLRRVQSVQKRLRHLYLAELRNLREVDIEKYIDSKLHSNKCCSFRYFQCPYDCKLVTDVKNLFKIHF